MELSEITPDQSILWQWEFIRLNVTIVYTWVVMALLTAVSWLVTRRLSLSPPLSRWQNVLEAIVDVVQTQIREVSNQEPRTYLPFIGTLFLFIVASNLLDVVPGFTSPTASLSTTAALAVCVFFAVPLYGIAEQGFLGYLKQYVRPTVFMLPFNVIGELSRTLALAVRLFGNVMSTGKIAAILLAVAPLFFPIVMDALGMLTGLIQAYIFAILAMVYIGSAAQARNDSQDPEKNQRIEKGDE